MSAEGRAAGAEGRWGFSAGSQGRITGVSLVLVASLMLQAVGCRRAPLEPISPGEVEGSPVSDAAGPPPEAHLVTATPREATATPVPAATVVVEPPRPLAAPPGFDVAVFADGLDAPRFMAVAENGDVFVTVPRLDRIVALPDRDGDGVADRVVVFAEGEPLNEPHGLDFHGRWLYVANTDSILRYPYQPGILVAPGPPDVVFPNLPGGPQHWTRTLIFGPDERMVVSVGSSCNVCVEDNFMRATIMHFNPDGSGASVLARGLRNAVGLAYHPDTGALWATENGRDLLGDDLPPDELNMIVAGEDYGWPYCYGNRVPDPDFANEARRCQSTRPADLDIPAHSAPLGLVFYRGGMFPSSWRGDAFIAYH
ncbi:MAG: PQQ-dependent sugar dehydrogenase, partial [Anaerolineae bacterium]